LPTDQPTAVPDCFIDARVRRGEFVRRPELCGKGIQVVAMHLH